MSTIAWTENVPSGTSQVGTFPRYGQSVWSAIAVGLATEHYWPGSGGGSDLSAGELLPGASRAFLDVASNSSVKNSQYTGRAFLASDTSRLYAYASAGTYLAGTPFRSTYSIYPGTGFWARQSGSFSTTATSGSRVITLPVSLASDNTVGVQCVPSNASWLVTGTPPTTSLFTSTVSALAGASGTLTVTWEVFGTVSQVSV